MGRNSKSSPQGKIRGMKFSFGALSEAGLVRQENEDSLYLDSHRGYFAVSDGMGGHKSGALASRIATHVLHQEFPEDTSLESIVIQMHESIRKEAAHNQEASNMGATVVLARVDASQFEIAWVGDSRGYLWNGFSLTQVTKDQTYVQELIDAEVITPHEALRHPKRHFLTYALGIGGSDEMIVGTVKGTIGPEETLMLCSDGLTNELSDGEISGVLANTQMSHQSQAEKLVEEANQRGGRDNISVLLVKPRGSDEDRFSDPTPFGVDSSTLPPEAFAASSTLEASSTGHVPESDSQQDKPEPLNKGPKREPS